MDEVSINILRDFVNDFMKYVEPFRSNRSILTSTRCRWLLTQHEKVFLKSYNYPGPQYHNVARRVPDPIDCDILQMIVEVTKLPMKPIFLNVFESERW